MLSDDFAARMQVYTSDKRQRSPEKREFMLRAGVESGYFKSRDEAAFYLDNMESRYSLFSDALTRGQRFVLSPMVVEAAEDFAASQTVVQHALDYIYLPAGITWIEWRGGQAGHQRSPRHGLMLVGQGEGNSPLVIGQGAYVFDSIAPGMKDDVLHEPIVFDLHDFIFKKVTVPGEVTRKEDFDEVARLGRFLVCVLALINTPRISHLIEHDIGEKLNRSRAKHGKPPLLSWHEVTIKPDVGWQPKTTHEEGETGERRRHHVRTFMRLKRGKVEIVKAHWRGNPDKGYVVHRHVVRMDGEEAGAWKGEPLPGPQIIKPDTTIPEE